MRRTSKVTGFVVGIVAMATVCAAEAESDSIAFAMHELEAAEKAFADAFAARDFESFASYIHTDAVFSGPDGPLQGKQAVLSVWQRYFETDKAPFRWAPERVLVGPDGNSGTTTGPVWDSNGNWVAAFSSTWQRQPGGRWQVVFDMSPSCPPARQAPAAAR